MAAWTQADLDIIEAAIAQGVTRVTWADGRSVQYPSLTDMLSLRQQMKDELAAASGTAPTRHSRASFSRE